MRRLSREVYLELTSGSKTEPSVGTGSDSVDTSGLALFHVSYRYGVAELFDSLLQLLPLHFQFRTPLHQFQFLLFFS